MFMHSSSFLLVSSSIGTMELQAGISVIGVMWLGAMTLNSNYSTINSIKNVATSVKITTGTSTSKNNDKQRSGSSPSPSRRSNRLKRSNKLIN